MTNYDPSPADRRPFNLMTWVDAHREELTPPVANKQIWREADMIVMIVGGGNERNDFHEDPREEFFFQVKGDMNLWIWPEHGVAPFDMPIREGEVYLLPPNLKHSPQRDAILIRLVSLLSISGQRVSSMRSSGHARSVRRWSTGLRCKCRPSTKICHHSSPPSTVTKRRGPVRAVVTCTQGKSGVCDHVGPPFYSEPNGRRARRRNPSAHIRDEFEVPDGIYMVGNSLGALPKATRDYVNTELDRWSSLGVKGHFTGDLAWKDYHALLTDQLASLVGAHADEVVAMNGLTVNLHLLMISFYQPNPNATNHHRKRTRSTSDHFAAESQIRQRGFDPAESLITLEPYATAKKLFDPKTFLPQSPSTVTNSHSSCCPVSITTPARYCRWQTS